MAMEPDFPFGSITLIVGLAQPRMPVNILKQTRATCTEAKASAARGAKPSKTSDSHTHVIHLGYSHGSRRAAVVLACVAEQPILLVHAVSCPRDLLESQYPWDRSYGGCGMNDRLRFENFNCRAVGWVRPRWRSALNYPAAAIERLCR